MRYELSIDATYLDDDRWNVAAGIREFLQNGRDAEIEQSAPLTVSHRGKRLVIENEGATLTRDSLLLGRSSKRDKQDVLAGKWGEGLKLGALALIRAGYKVTIRNGSEVWTPVIESSEKFAGRDVLVFNVATGRQERNRVRVEVDGVTSGDWQTLREHYLFLRKGVGDVVKTNAGDLLLGSKQKGCVYVKGILVKRDPKLEYGYNLNDAQLDRDRQMIEQWDLNYRLKSIWFAATAERPDLIEKFAKLVEDGVADAEGVSEYNVADLPQQAKDQIVARFRKRHGGDAVGVPGLAESKDIEHLGRKGIVVKKQLQAVLESVVGTLDDVKKSLAHEAVREYAWGDLGEVERNNLESAIALVAAAGYRITLNDIQVADFRSKNLMGQYRIESDGSETVAIARRVLANRSDTLETLVHEVAHRDGGDGDKGHVETIEVLWATIVENLRVKMESA